MMGSLRAGMSSLKAHLAKMNVVGANVANVNTIAYKSQDVQFAERLTERMRGGSRPGQTIGGSNPVQFGTGVKIGQIETNFANGALEETGVNTHVALQGEGFFVVNDGTKNAYTRAGNFSFDAAGNLVNPSGLKVQGVMANGAGAIPVGAPTTDIRIPDSLQASAVASTAGSVFGNLDANSAVGDVQSTYITVVDSLGNEHAVQVNFTKTGVNAWSWDAQYPVGTPVGSGNATFNPDGSLNTFDDGAGGPPTFAFTPAGANPLNITLNGTTGTGLRQNAATGALVARKDDGYGVGDLQSVSIDKSGIITGSFTNGSTMQLAQIAIADFTNPGGLDKGAAGLYYEAPNSGVAMRMIPGQGNTTTLTSGALEGSNADLTEQFTEMIITQRGYQSAARIITTSDEMLQEAVNLKR